MHENGDERYDEECILPDLLNFLTYIFNAHQQKEYWDEW
jgi:hypothetical protein